MRDTAARQKHLANQAKEADKAFRREQKKLQKLATDKKKAEEAPKNFPGRALFEKFSSHKKKKDQKGTGERTEEYLQLVSGIGAEELSEVLDVPEQEYNPTFLQLLEESELSPK